jgi:hypothetical protein
VEDGVFIVDHLVDNTLNSKGLANLIVRKFEIDDVACTGEFRHVESREVGIVLVE